MGFHRHSAPCSVNTGSIEPPWWPVGCRRLLLPPWMRSLLALPPAVSSLVAGPPPLKLARRVVVAVGDYVAALLLGSGLYPRLLVVDCKTLRAEYSGCPSAKLIEAKGYRVVRVDNPPGSLDSVAASTVWCGLRGYEAGRLAVLVNGEEDMLALAAVLSAPLGGLVAYGYPRLAAVYVEATRATKAIVRSIIGRMECVTAGG